MLRKQIMVAILISIFSLIFSSCSSNPGNSNLGINSINSKTTNENVEINGNCIERSNIVYKNMEAAFRDNNQKLFSIKKFFLDLRKHDPKQMGNLLSDDVTFIISGRVGIVPLAGTYRGKADVERYVRSFCSSIYNAQMILQYNLVGPESINTHVQLIGQVRSSGKTMNLELAYNWVLNNDGKIKFLRLYYDTYAWYNAFQPGGSNYVEDMKGKLIDIQPVNFDTVQFIKEVYLEFNTMNLPPLLDKMDDNLVFVLKGDTNCVYPSIYNGKTGFLQFCQNLFGVAYYTQTFIINSIIVQGNHIDVLAHEELIWRATGKPFTSDNVHSFVVSDKGTILSFLSYNDTFDVYYASLP